MHRESGFPRPVARAGFARVAGGPAAVITDRAVLRPMGESHELHLASLHPGNSLAEVQAKTGWPLAVSDDLAETAPPTADEIAALRAIDRDGYWH